MENWEEVLGGFSYGNDANGFLTEAYRLNQTRGCPKHIIEYIFTINYLYTSEESKITKLMEEFLKTPRIVGYQDNREICKCCYQPIGEYHGVPIYDVSELKPWIIQEQLNLFGETDE